MSIITANVAPRPAPGAVAAARSSARTAGGWVGLLGAVLVGPVLARLVVGTVAPLWSQLVTLTGLLAASGLVCAAILPSRLPALSQSVGITAVFQAHRFLGIFAASMTAAHIGFVLAADPAFVNTLVGLPATPAARAATGASLVIAGLIALGAIRHRVRCRYERWRWAHIGLAVAGLALAGLHVVLVGSLVRDAVMRWVLFAVAAVAILGLGYRWLVRPALGASEHVLLGVRFESDAVCTLVLRPRGRPLRFAPGQFIWLRLSRGSGAEEHPFTVASGAHVSGRTEITLRCTGDFGRALAALPAGTPLWIDGPHGAFSVDFIRAPAVVMIAAGVGITPMMSMLRTLAGRRDRRPLVLVRTARRAEDLLFGVELAGLTGVLDLTVVDVPAAPAPGRAATGGTLPDVLARVLPRTALRGELAYFVCGPPALVGGALDALRELGVPEARIHTEQFDT